jgi:antibiotic biosynthesis monooxygenase
VSLWTVDTWTVRDGHEQAFVTALRSLMPETTPLFRDLEEEHRYWCPRRWEDSRALDAWHAEIKSALDAMVEDHAAHLMESVT